MIQGCKLGITGGMGCGKTTFVAMLEARGFRRVSTDDIAKSLLAKDAEVVAHVRERFGKMVYLEDGTLNRSLLAAKVFGDNEALNWLEALLHPKVRNLWETLLESDPKTHWAVEIPLLFENKLEKAFDYVVCIAASAAVQRKRLEARHLDAEQQNARLARQLPLTDKVIRANMVVWNDGLIEALASQADLVARCCLNHP